MGKLFKYDRAVNAILYSLAQLGGNTDMHKLCKILYFADQQHISRYGRSITGDTYIAMRFGPVPSCVDDILKALRGDSFFSNCVTDLNDKIAFENRYIVKGLADPDMDELSESDVECLDYAIGLCKDKSFAELTAFSHGLAWGNTKRDHAISVEDILREAGDSEAYVKYIGDNLKMQSAFL